MKLKIQYLLIAEALYLWSRVDSNGIGEELGLLLTMLLAAPGLLITFPLAAWSGLFESDHFLAHIVIYQCGIALTTGFIHVAQILELKWRRRRLHRPINNQR